MIISIKKMGVVLDERNFYSYTESREHPNKRKVSPVRVDTIPLATIEKGMMNKKSAKKICEALSSYCLTYFCDVYGP